MFYEPLAPQKYLISSACVPESRTAKAHTTKPVSPLAQNLLLADSWVGLQKPLRLVPQRLCRSQDIKIVSSMGQWSEKSGMTKVHVWGQEGLKTCWAPPMKLFPSAKSFTFSCRHFNAWRIFAAQHRNKGAVCVEVCGFEMEESKAIWRNGGGCRHAMQPSQ